MQRCKNIHEDAIHVRPDSIYDVDDSICQEVLKCEQSGKPYKIIQQELEYYKKHGIPLPRLCPAQRHLNRNDLGNPRQLWKRECGECGKAIDTSYKEGRGEKVVCEGCYLSAVY